MIVGLDHVVIVVADLDAATADYRTLLGRAPSWTGARDGAQTALFTLANTSVELLAPARGDGAAAERIATVLRERGEGLASLCFRTDDIAALHRRLERMALKPEPVSEVESRDADSGRTLRWLRTRAATEATGGVRLFFIQLQGERPRAEAIADAPIAALDHVVVSTAHPERAAALYGARLKLEMTLDRSHPDWGRLMFFRCGDLNVEVTNRPGAKPDAPDALWGVCWRVADIDAARRRLVAAGVAVSEVRTGRKPGTRVATVRSHSCGVPTLLLEPSPPRA